MRRTELSNPLTPEQRRELTQKSNWPAISDFSVHAGIIGLLTAMVVAQVPCWQLLLLPSGIAQVFLFTPMHETTHATAFKSARLNNTVNRICALVILVPPNWFRYFHLAHHRHTQDPAQDPELASPKPATLRQYLVHISGLPTYWSSLKTLVINATGRDDYNYVPASASGAVKTEARLMLAVYCVLLSLSIAFGSIVLLWAWVLPLLLGQPFLRVYLLAEHSGCQLIPDMLLNTRTTLTNWLVQRLAWNMPYHTEHHQLPTVPYFRLAEYHTLLRDDIQNLETGYTRFNRSYIRGLDSQIQTRNQADSP